MWQMSDGGGGGGGGGGEQKGENSVGAQLLK